MLLAGGFGQASTELFDPTTEIWTATKSMSSTRNEHTATLLLDGMVLVTGGSDTNTVALSLAELYDPGSGS